MPSNDDTDVDNSSLTSTYEHFEPIDEDQPAVNADRSPLLSNDSSDSDSDTISQMNHSSDHKYEDFSSKLGLQCPTCKGKGKLTQGQADSMVALIPVRDKRLKPRKTKLYLGITFVICVVVTFLVTFFLLPRSVTIEVADLTSKYIYMPNVASKLTPYIDVLITYKIKNDNFFKADVSDISQDISWNRFLLNSSVISGNEKFHIDGRTVMNHTVTSRQVFQGDVSSKVKRICGPGWNWYLLEMFVNTATVSYLYRSEQISNTYYGYTGCHNSSLVRLKRKINLKELTGT